MTATGELSRAETGTTNHRTAQEGQPSPSPEAGKGHAGRGKRRDLWIDSLRAVALLRVTVYHVFGWIWLPAVFPSMGIMFAMAGSLMAGSLDRAERWPWGVLRQRLRRLLPPLWLMGAIVVPVMLRNGWTNRGPDSAPLTWGTALLWVLPVSDPPGSDWGADWVTPLWYIRTYLWLVLLSPTLLWLLRRWPRRTLAVPFAVMGAVTVQALQPQGRGGDVLLELATYGGCWMLGFAHHDGTLQRLSWRQVASAAIALMGAGLAWALTHPTPAAGWNLDEIPPAQTLYCFGSVLVLLRVRPSMTWLGQRSWFTGVVALVNARAVSIYLWNNVAVFLAAPLLDAWSLTRNHESGVTGQALSLAATLVCLVAILPAVGWVEDVAARRRPRLVPWPRRAAARPDPVPDRTRPPWYRDAARRRVALAAPLAASVLALGVLTSWRLGPGVMTTSSAPVGGRASAVPDAALLGARSTVDPIAAATTLPTLPIPAAVRASTGVKGAQPTSPTARSG